MYATWSPAARRAADGDGATPERAATAPALDRQRALATVAGAVATGLLFAALFVGDRPFASELADKAATSRSGNAFNRVVVFAAFAASVPMALLHLERVLKLLLRNWPVGLFVLWSGLSYIWADHPGLVLRRAFAFALVYLTLVTLAATAGSARDWLGPLTAVFALVTLLNIVAVAAFPAASRSDIGENGIFDNKNTAGTMAMLAIVVLATSLLSARSTLVRLALLGVTGLACLFLLLTRSKTSIGVTGLALAAGPCLYVVLGSRAPARMAAAAGGIAAAALATVTYLSAGYDDADLRLMLFGDLTFTGRTEIWEHLLPEIARHQWFGQGFGSFWDTGALVNPIASAPPSAWFMNAQLINTAHNGYLDVLLQTGLVGMALTTAAILRCLWVLGSGAAAGERGERIAATGALCVVLCLVLNNLLESYLFRTGDALGYLFILLMLHGEAAALRRSASGGEVPALAPLPPELAR